MQWPAKAGVAVISALLVIAVASPLIVFFLEFASDPEHLITLSVSDVKLDPATGNATVVLKIGYSGTVPLKDFTVYMLGENITVGDVVKGEKTIQFSVSAEQVTAGAGGRASVSEVALSFRIAGVYWVKITVKGAVHG